MARGPARRGATCRRTVEGPKREHGNITLWPEAPRRRGGPHPPRLRANYEIAG
jgi:hypothetical protein